MTARDLIECGIAVALLGLMLWLWPCHGDNNYPGSKP